MVITGGPGTGKTTIIKGILRLLAEYGCRAALAAPTGRAAKRMTEATGYEAKTIHRLLETGYNSEESDELVFYRNETNPIEADAVIIDEMSMVDILLMNHLLKAIPPGARLILVGDADQLPSVGAGSVLLDIINCSSIRTVRLTEIFRQAEESLIIVNAHRINRRPHPQCKGQDFFFLARNGQENILRTVIDLCAGDAETYGLDPLKDIQGYLRPKKAGRCGQSEYRTAKVLNPQDGKKTEGIQDIYAQGRRQGHAGKNNYSLRWESLKMPGSTGPGFSTATWGRSLK